MSGEQAQASALPENSGTQAWRALTSAGDSGAGATAGPFKSQIGGIGPQIGFLFPVGEMQGVPIPEREVSGDGGSRQAPVIRLVLLLPETLRFITGEIVF